MKVHNLNMTDSLGVRDSVTIFEYPDFIYLTCVNADFLKAFGVYTLKISVEDIELNNFPDSAIKTQLVEGLQQLIGVMA